MSAYDWEDCFAEVLFPLLNKLLSNISPMDPIGMDEIRVRAIQLITKILLNQHMSLLSLDTFPDLVLRLVEYMDRYLKSGHSDLLAEAIPETLKNMILVFGAGVFVHLPQLHSAIAKRVSVFLPELVTEVMKTPPNPSRIGSVMPPADGLQRIALSSISHPSATENIQISRPLEVPSTSESTVMANTNDIPSMTSTMPVTISESQETTGL
jgi:brefeldin A-resistance guanine nucleotide exchange factor 1